MIYATVVEGGRWYRLMSHTVRHNWRDIAAIRCGGFVFDLVLLRMGEWPFRRAMRVPRG